MQARRLAMTPHSTDLWYFGYGSNMNRTVFCERRRMRPLSTRIGWMEGHRMCFNLPIGPGERGVANVEPADGWRLWGVLYLLTAEEFDRLDQTEGVHLGAYHRVPVDVHVTAAERIQAHTYSSTLTREGRKPSARYMRLILEGARQHELPSDYIRLLEEIELARDEREGH
jgi:cation transport regulator ChaC